MDENDIVDECRKYKCKFIVLTGGEPTKQDLKGTWVGALPIGCKSIDARPASIVWAGDLFMLEFFLKL